MTWIKKPPNAPIAPAMPITAAAWCLKSSTVVLTSRPFSAASLRPSAAKIDGIIRYVEPLPIPASRKMTMNEPKKTGKLCWLTPMIAVTVNSASPRKTANVTRAPPTLSDSQPPSGRDIEPISAPMKPSPAR